jgi:bone morphogenetic protein 9/10
MGLEQSPLEEDMPLFEDVFSEQDGMDFTTLLQSMKDEFLKTLNLSDIPMQDSAKVDPPEYMLELYNKFATDRTSVPSANIIRSFKNEGKSAFLLLSPGLDFSQETISKFITHGDLYEGG